MLRRDAIIESPLVRRFRRTWLAVFSLAFVSGYLSITAQNAQATCGDYLSHSFSNFDGGSQMLHMPSMTGHPPNTGVPPARPCRGLSCHRSPLHQPIPVPAISIESHDHWILALDSSTTSLNQVAYRIRFRERIGLPAVPFRLDRPPKI